MNIIVDTRERELFKELDSIVKTSDAQSSPRITSSLLDVGDCHICMTTGTNENVEVMIERKTLQDVGASIKDGRWSEQKLRALSMYPPHKIFYILELTQEDDLFHYHDKYSRIDTDTILSASLNLFIKWRIPFIFIRGTHNVARFIYKLCLQLKKHKDLEQGSVIEEMHSESYVSSSCIQLQKQKNMTPQIYFRFALQGVPGISTKTAKQIQELFDGTLTSFIDFLRDQPKEVFCDIYKKKTGRNISKTVVKNLYHLFLYDPHIAHQSSNVQTLLSTSCESTTSHSNCSHEEPSCKNTGTPFRSLLLSRRRSSESFSPPT